MSSRVAGAGLALIAAALFAVSIATPVVVPAEFSLFAGHPKVNGRTLEMQDAYVGFFGAQLCNTGGDGACKSREPKKTFQITAFAELGVSGLLGVSAVMLALLTLRRTEGRKGLARFVRLLAVLAAGGAGALIVLGPTDQGAIPIGIGMGIYGGAVVGAFLASIIAVRPPPPIKLRAAGRTPQPVATPPAPQPIDIQALFGEDQLRPAELGPEPMLRRDARGRLEPSPPPREPEDADPFAAPFAAPFTPPAAPPIAPPGGEKPLFSSAPQLRPLYDAAPIQGGTGGLLPLERPAMPTRPPTPLPRAAISAVAGIPTPPPFPAERPKTLPPPNFGARNKPASIPPPLPPGPSPRTNVSLVPPMPDNDLPIPPPAPAAGPPLAPPASHAGPPLAHAPTLPVQVPPPGRPSLAHAATLPVQVAPPVPPVPAVHDGAPAPPVSNGSPEAGASPPNTEPVPFGNIETPLAPPPLPVTPTPRPRPETPLAPPPPPVASAPRPQRDSKPPPRPQRDSQSPPLAPLPGVRASVPLPARPGRQPPGPTRPPLPLPATAPRPAIPAPVMPPLSIPPIPAIPSIPAIPPPSNRAETDPQERASTNQFVDPSTGLRAPTEVGDSTSPNLSFGRLTSEEVDAALDEVGATYDAPGDVLGQANLDGAIPPIDPTDEHHREINSTDVNPVVAPSAATVAPASAARPALPLPIPLTSPPARDRPMPKLPISTAPDSLPPPKDNKAQTGPSPACPQCEAPMAWVEEHLRFYCKSCRMYF